MIDFDRFKTFFDAMGVPYSTYLHTPLEPDVELNDEGLEFVREYNEEHKGFVFVMCVAQAIFYFDAHGRYAAVKADEMGYIVRRLERT